MRRHGTAVTILGLIVCTVSNLPLTAQNLAASRTVRAQDQAVGKFILNEADFVMPASEASQYSHLKIEPLLFDCIDDTSEPDGLRRRIQEILKRIEDHRLYYAPTPAYYPDRSLNVISKLEHIETETYLFLFVPAARDMQKSLSTAEFKYLILIAFAHEVVHIEQSGRYRTDSQKEAGKEEAIAWGKTVVEIIRPLIAQQKSVPAYFVELSNLFAKAKNNSGAEAWIKLWIN
jgi:hypothetical protein